MPASNTDYSKIKQYQEQAASLTSQGAGLEASAGTLGDTVMKAVRDARTARGVSKLATDVGNVAGQMVTDPTGIRERTSGMVDPFSVNALTSNARAQNLRTLGTISTQQTANQTPIDEVIQAGANKLKAQAANLYAKAQEAEAQSTALQNEWERNMEERKQAWTEYEDQQRLNLSGKEGTTIEDVLSTASKFKALGAPSSGQEDNATNARSVLNAVELVKAATPEDLKKAAQISSTVGAEGFGALAHTFAKWTSTPAQIELAQALATVRNVLRLKFTGAAFSTTERPEYTFLTGDWTTATKDPEQVRTSMKNLEPYFKEVVKSGENPYQTQIDALMMSLGTSDWEIESKE